MSRTSVIIVTYNAQADLEACVESLSDEPPFEVIIVDNCSSDDTRPIARRLVADRRASKLIESETNDGFARAVNRGIRASSGDGVFLLNPDARISGRDLRHLEHVAASDRSIGILAPLVDSGPSVPTLSAGLQPRLWPLFTHFSGLARLFPHVRALRGRHLYRAHHSITQDVEWVSGCALYITPSALPAIGSLSERWFMYGEDIELAKRAVDLGFRVVMNADVRAWHAIGTSANASTSSVATMWARNTYDFYVTAYNPGVVRRFLWRIIFSTGLLSRAAVLSIRSRTRRGDEARAARARAARFRRFAGAVWTPRHETRAIGVA